MINKIYNWACSIKKKETALAYLIQFFYKVFSNAAVQTLVTSIAGIIIPLLVNPNEDICEFCIIIIIFILINIIFGICNCYKNKTYINRRFKHHLVNSLSHITNSLTIEVQTNPNYRSNILKTTGDIVCRELHKLCKTIFNEDVRVSIEYIFTKEIDGKFEKCTKMISRCSPEREVPRNKTFNLNNINRKKYYSNQIFRDNQVGIHFLNNDEITHTNKWYVNPTHTNKVIQYLSIAKSIDNENVAFIFQIDSLTTELFGKNNVEAQNFANEYLSPYVNILRLAYTLNMNRKGEVVEI